MAQQYGGFLQSLATVRDAKTGRLSSWIKAVRIRIIG
jgi:hypothetical protein